jgi:sec-independent protein translocase protein TatB
MFDFDLGKLLLIGVVALIFIPPKDLPDALRQLGRLIGQARRMASDFQGQFSEALREAELSQLKDDLHNLKQRASVEDTFGRIADMLEKPVEGKAAEASGAAETPRPPETAAVPAPLASAPEPRALPETPNLEPGKTQ